jgi:extracellular elastinolytic metalloproteinase
LWSFFPHSSSPL